MGNWSHSSNGAVKCLPMTTRDTEGFQTGRKILRNTRLTRVNNGSLLATWLLSSLSLMDPFLVWPLLAVCFLPGTEGILRLCHVVFQAGYPGPYSTEDAVHGALIWWLSYAFRFILNFPTTTTIILILFSGHDFGLRNKVAGANRKYEVPHCI